MGFFKRILHFSGQFEEQKMGPVSYVCGSHVTTKLINILINSMETIDMLITTNFLRVIFVDTCL